MELERHDLIEICDRLRQAGATRVTLVRVRLAAFRSRENAMEQTVRTWGDAAFSAWQNATLIDYAHIVLSIIVLGWFVGRYFSSR